MLPIINFTKTAGLAIYEIADVLSSNGQFKESIITLDELTVNIEKYQDLKSRAFYLLASNYMMIADYDRAIFFAQKSLMAFKDKHIKRYVYLCANILAECYEKQGKLDSSLKYTRLHHAFKDSIYNQQVQVQMAQLNTELETLGIQKELEILAKENELEQANKKSLVISLIAILTIAVLLVVSLLFRHASNQKKQRLVNLELERKNEILDEELYHQTLHMIKLNNSLGEIQSSLSAIKTKTFITKEDLNILVGNIKINKAIENEWENFDKHFGKKYQNFYEKLLRKHKNLSIQNRRFAALIRIDLSNREISQILNITQNSAKMGRYRLKSKLGLKENEELTRYLVNL